MRVILGIFYLLTLFGSVVGFFIAFNSFVSSTSAPQQAAGAAVGIACGVLPYVFARSLHAFESVDVQRKCAKYLKEVARLLSSRDEGLHG